MFTKGDIMTTKVFSSRADEGLLAYADALAHREYGLSYGQYCGTVLLEAIKRDGHMPQLASSKEPDAKAQAASFLKGFAKRKHDVSIGKMPDKEIRELIASRYE
jgi:hypothetical protein